MSPISTHDLMRRLQQPAETKIVLLVADGLGGLPMVPGGKTELETARTPNLDRLASEGTLGLSTPVAPGITPGSGPAHLGLFGYDPLEYEVGRGVLEALGIDMEVRQGDVAIRGNFCTVDEAGRITDRRAGRISTERGTELVAKLQALVSIPGVEVTIEPVKEYRFALRFRADGLGDRVRDTDPGQVGVPPLPPVSEGPQSDKTARLATEFLHQAAEILRDEFPANFLTLRGFACLPNIAPMRAVYGLHPIAIAVYPMYRGLARLVGMRIVDPGTTVADQIRVLGEQWDNGDFFFIHYKYTDSTGEDGDFDSKVRMIEALDAEIARIAELRPDALVVTGDHCTPAKMRSHSFHPSPVLLWAPDTARPDLSTEFGERACQRGGLGHVRSRDLMPLAMAHAGRLRKFGA
jgi:2,3-bisphosphoglycerate-independent phosphoglycerate mutase